MEIIHYLMEYKTGFRPAAFFREKFRYYLPSLRGKYEFVRRSGECCLRTKIISAEREGIYIAAVLSDNGNTRSQCMMLVQKKSISLSEVETVLEYRRQGFGKLMIKLLQENFKGSGKAIRLHVMKENLAAIHLYDSLKFKIRESLVYFTE